MHVCLSPTICGCICVCDTGRCARCSSHCSRPSLPTRAASGAATWAGAPSSDGKGRCTYQGICDICAISHIQPSPQNETAASASAAGTRSLSRSLDSQHPARHSAPFGAVLSPSTVSHRAGPYVCTASLRWLWRNLRVSQPQTPPRHPRRCCCLVPTSHQVRAGQSWCKCDCSPVVAPGEVVGQSWFRCARQSVGLTDDTQRMLARQCRAEEVGTSQPGRRCGSRLQGWRAGTRKYRTTISEFRFSAPPSMRMGKPSVTSSAPGLGSPLPHLRWDWAARFCGRRGPVSRPWSI